MSYEHCDLHDADATNGCDECAVAAEAAELLALEVTMNIETVKPARKTKPLSKSERLYVLRGSLPQLKDSCRACIPWARHYWRGEDRKADQKEAELVGKARRVAIGRQAKLLATECAALGAQARSLSLATPTKQ